MSYHRKTKSVNGVVCISRAKGADRRNWSSASIVEVCYGFGRRKRESEMKKWAWVSVGASVGLQWCNYTLLWDPFGKKNYKNCHWVNKPITWKQAWAVSKIGNPKLKKLGFVNWVNKQKIIQTMFPYVGPTNFGLWVNKTQFCKIQTRPKTFIKEMIFP